MPSIKAALSASAIALLASAANAHMILSQPPPYGTPDNSPLDAGGANFPCKATSNSGGPVTTMAIGSQQQLVFLGESVHGGGSCQVSLTTDNPATKDSKWMVIHSIIGGCPARNAAGNLGADNSATAIDPDKYNYTIPQGITPGTYTLAWTWFNKIGNREMYMNCANVKITGGSSKRDVDVGETDDFANSTTIGERDVYGSELDDFVHPDLVVRAASFPPMFVANIPTTDCETVDSQDVLFPDPGTSVESANANPADKPVAPTGPKCGASGAAAPAATGAASASSGAASPAASPAASAASPDSQSGAGGASPAATPAPSAAAPDSQSAPAPVMAASPASSPAAPTSAASPAAPAATGVSNSSGGGASTGTCTQPGQSICSPDGLQIGTCTQENTVTWIPVAAGTKCSGGLMVAAKRSPKFAENYVRRVM